MIAFDLFTLVTALAMIAYTLPEWWLTLGDVRWQRAHR